MKTLKIISALLLPLAFFGCAGADPKAAFHDVSDTATARTGASIRWTRMESTNQLSPRIVSELLKTNLTAATAVQIALLNNASLQAAFEEIGISQAELAQASRLPNIELAGSWRFPNRPPSAADIEYSASGNFLDLLTLPARTKIAARNLEQAKLKVADAILRLAGDTQTAFYSLQAEMELAGRLELILEVNDAAADLAQRQFNAGNINELELANQQAPAAQTRVELINARARVRLDRERLNRLLGLSGAQLNWQIATELPPLPSADPPSENLESAAINQRLDLAAARSRTEALASALRLKQRTRFIPGLKVGVDTERTPDGQRVTGPTLDLEVPIFDQGQPALARLAAELAQARANYAAHEMNVRSEVRQAWDALLAAREAVEFSQKNLLPLRQKILRQTLLHYNAMQKNPYDLLLAKEREQMAGQTFVASLRDYWLARVELERAVGGRLNPETKSSSIPERSKP